MIIFRGCLLVSCLIELVVGTELSSAHKELRIRDRAEKEIRYSVENHVFGFSEQRNLMPKHAKSTGFQFSRAFILKSVCFQKKSSITAFFPPFCIGNSQVRVLLLMVYGCFSLCRVIGSTVLPVKMESKGSLDSWNHGLFIGPWRPVGSRTSSCPSFLPVVTRSAKYRRSVMSSNSASSSILLVVTSKNRIL